MAVSRSRSRGFFALAGLAMMAMALTGFWPQYYGRIASGAAFDTQAAHLLIHIHSTLFLGWLTIFVVQALLIDSGRMALHARVGPLLAGYGYLAATFGIAAAVGLAARRVTLGSAFDEAAAFVLAPLLDMAAFVGFLTAALYWRRSAETHKRLMLCATYCFAFIGVVRFLAHHTDWLTDPLTSTVALTAPLALFAILDTFRTGRLHATWVWGIAVFVGRLLIEYLGTTEAWLQIGRQLIAPYV